MLGTSRHLLAATLLVSLASTRLQAQTSAETQLRARQSLAELEGVYRYRDGGSLVMVADGERLVAIIGEAKYPLRAFAADTFANPSGDLIPFVRDTAGFIVAFKEYGDSFARLATVVGAETRQLLVPRPALDGRALRYRCTAPPALTDGIRVAGMGPETLSCAVATQVVNGVLDGTYPDVRAIAVHHNGALVLEEYFYGFERDRPHQMRSLTKSIISLLAGVAVDRGLLRANEPVVARLGYSSIANPDPRKDQITLSDLLSNQSGLACDDHDRASPGNEVKLYAAADWPKAFVDLPAVAEPGRTGRYCSFGFITAGRIIELAAGKPLAEFAQEVLFGPLGISPTQWRWTFVLDHSQRNEFAQIYLRPRDMLKLGLLIHQRGVWQGRRVVSESWIDAAVARQSRVDDSDYGLGIWHRWYAVPTANGTQRVETIMLSGNGGQKIYIVPALELVVVFTGGAFNVESPTNRIMARVLLPALLDTRAASVRPAHP
jgi:CubicO group peptidase (beta-lactamase class C family)